MQSCAVRGSLLVLSVLLAASPASGEEESLATVQLRGGYDANPTGLPKGAEQGSAFVTAGAAVAIGRDYAGGKVAFAGEGQHTEFASGITPTDRARFALETEHDLDIGWTLRTSMRADNVTSYDTRALNMVGKIKLQPSEGVFRPFVTGEVRYSTLNETNILIADFLPEPEKFVRGTIIPGFAIVHSKTFEFGVSASISFTHYLNDADPLGFDRDNTRIQPFLFATYKDDTLDVAASVSRFDGRWDDANFANVQETLYDFSLTKTLGDFKLDLAAKRSAEDTTFPYVPVTLATSAAIGLSYKLTSQTTLRVSAKNFRTDYPGVELTTKTTTFGVGASYDFAKDWTFGLDAAYQRGTLIDDESMSGAMVSFSLTRKFNLAQK
jgi:opacity protein-like surface antigen